MKFTGKMLALVAVLLAVSLSVGGYTVLRSSFQSAIEAEWEDAQEDMQMFSLTVQAICTDELSRGNESRAAVELQSFLHPARQAEQREFSVHTGDGTLIAGSDGAVEAVFPERNGTMEIRILTVGEEKYVVASLRLSIHETVLYLSRSRVITPIFHRAEDALSRYCLIMLVILAVGLSITAVMTLYLTRPVRRIARAAKQFSEGRYDRRAAVRSEDELGRLAQTFDEMADALEAKIRELADAAQRQKEFTASFAHELKTPLTSVIGYADTLRSRQLPAKMQMEAANYIFSEGKRLEAMSFALLKLFALEGETPQFRRLSACHLAEVTAKSSDYLLKEAGISLILRVREYSLHGAGELLQALLYNLIDNARKASEQGGQIVLEGYPVEDGYRFAVIDHGRGIPPEALERLTEPFFMVDKSRSRAQGGAGLGLALCKRIAALHHGELKFESTPGEGTCVTLDLREEDVPCKDDIGSDLPLSY